MTRPTLTSPIYIVFFTGWETRESENLDTLDKVLDHIHENRTPWMPDMRACRVIEPIAILHLQEDGRWIDASEDVARHWAREIIRDAGMDLEQEANLLPDLVSKHLTRDEFFGLAQ